MEAVWITIGIALVLSVFGLIIAWICLVSDKKKESSYAEKAVARILWKSGQSAKGMDLWEAVCSEGLPISARSFSVVLVELTDRKLLEYSPKNETGVLQRFYTLTAMGDILGSEETY